MKYPWLGKRPFTDNGTFVYDLLGLIVIVSEIWTVIRPSVVRALNHQVAPPHPLHQFLELRHILNPVHAARLDNQPFQANVVITSPA